MIARACILSCNALITVGGYDRENNGSEAGEMTWGEVV